MFAMKIGRRLIMDISYRRVVVVVVVVAVHTGVVVVVYFAVLLRTEKFYRKVNMFF